MGMTNLLGGLLQGLSQSYLTQKQRSADEQVKLDENEMKTLQAAHKVAMETGDIEHAGFIQDEIIKRMAKAATTPEGKNFFARLTEAQAAGREQPQASAPLLPTKAGGPQPNPNMQAPSESQQAAIAPPPSPFDQGMSEIDRIVGQYTNPTAQRVMRGQLTSQLAKERFQQLTSPTASAPPRPAGVVQVVVQDDTSPTKWSSVSIIEEPTGTREIGRVKGVAPPASATPRADNQTFEEATYADWLKAVPQGYDANRVGYAKWKSDQAAERAASSKSDTIYSVYPVQVGTNPDGSPIIQYLSPTAAQGKSPAKTIYGPGGQAITGTAVGYSTSPPPGVPSDVQTSLAGWAQAISTIDRIIPQLKQLKGSLGPFSGRITLGEINRLGGMGASNEQIRLATDLRRLLMSQAFAEGGKQLTPTEKEEFKALNPALSDTFEQALIKAQQSRDYLDRRYKMRVEFLGPRQQGQVPASPPIGPPPAPDGASVPKVGETFQGKRVLKVEKVQ